MKQFRFNPLELTICGSSNSGKTTFVSRLIGSLSSEYSVAYVKHAEKFQMDREGKDTWKAARAGAEPVIVTTDSSHAVLATGVADAGQHAGCLLAADFVLAEGWKNTRMPKLVMLDAEGRIPAAEVSDRFEAVLGCIGPGPRPSELPPDLPHFNRDDIDAVKIFVLEWLHDRVARRPVYGLAIEDGEGAAGRESVCELLRRFCDDAYSVADVIRTAESEDRPVMTKRGSVEGSILTAMLARPNAAWLVVESSSGGGAPGQIEGVLRTRNPFHEMTLVASQPFLGVLEPKAVFGLIHQFCRGRTVEDVAWPSPAAAHNHSVTGTACETHMHGVDD